MILCYSILCHTISLLLFHIPFLVFLALSDCVDNLWLPDTFIYLELHVMRSLSVRSIEEIRLQMSVEKEEDRERERDGK